MEKKFPRVLLVMMTKIYEDDPVNLLIRQQFNNWPKENLAQIYSGQTKGVGEFCGFYYELGKNDRLFGNVFQMVKKYVTQNIISVERNKNRNSKYTPKYKLIHKTLKTILNKAIINSGLWEVVFKVRCSAELLNFVSSFKPEYIYCQGYNLGFTNLPLEIGRRFSIPICFQITDDWPRKTYKNSPIGIVLRRQAKALILKSRMRLAFGEKMKKEFEKRYRVPFEVTYHLDDEVRFQQVTRSVQNAIRIIYTGSLGHKRYEAILDLLEAIREIKHSGLDISIDVYTSSLMLEIPAVLVKAPEIRFADLPSHSKLPEVLVNASLLFLPESFSEAREAIEYSISTKAHLYMMSNRPILAYGPNYSGTINYAKTGGWALVVENRNADLLKSAVKNLLSDTKTCEKQKAASLMCLKMNHSAMKGRDWFRQQLM